MNRRLNDFFDTEQNNKSKRDRESEPARERGRGSKEQLNTAAKDLTIHRHPSSVDELQVLLSNRE